MSLEIPVKLHCGNVVKIQTRQSVPWFTVVYNKLCIIEFNWFESCGQTSPVNKKFIRRKDKWKHCHTKM